MSRSRFELLPNELAKHLMSYVPLNYVTQLPCTSITNHSIFQPIANELKALEHIVHGAEATLINLIKRTIKEQPELLFQKGSIVDPRGRFIDSISPYQLIIFLCDEVMKEAVIPFIPKEMEPIRQRQYKELGTGGADLIRIDKKPELIKDVRAFNTTYSIYGEQVSVTFSLLENPDGIIFYLDEEDKVHFYYVNQDTEALICLEPEAQTEEAQLALDTLIASFMAMEQNSGRRSSDAEHQLIQQIMQITLHREGIRYEQEGVRFQDSRTEFRLINKYRACMRLCDEAANHGGEEDKVHQFWREEVGKAQGEVMWILQRLCEEDRPFYPLPANFNGFKRGFSYYNVVINANNGRVFSNGKLDDGLGKDFCLGKGRAPVQGMDMLGWLYRFDLIAVCRLVERAKANVVEEFKPNQDLVEPPGVHMKQ